MSHAVAAAATVLVCPCVAASQATPVPSITRFQELKAEALLRDQLPCLGCHALNGTGGRIGPDLSSVGTRRDAGFIAAMVADPQRAVPGTVMPRVAMPGATRELIVRYLAARRVEGPVASPLVPAPAGGARDGASLYARYCAACHGTTGRGDGPNAAHLPVRPAAHASRAAMSQRSDDALFDTIFGGGAIMNRSPRMPGYGETLSGEEIRLLVRHIRTLCRCTGPDWSRDEGGRR